MRQLKSSSAISLANFISDRRRAGHLPPLLWLGHGCSISAGCSTEQDLLARVSEVLGVKVSSREELRGRFTEHHQELLHGQSPEGSTRRLGYSLLAQLVAKGYFRMIITSSSDFQLEDQLRAVLPYPKVVIATHHNQTDEEIARQLNNLRSDSVFSFHYHDGFEGERDASANHFPQFEPPLRDELRRLIAKHGLVFIGYSVAESQLTQLLSDTKKVWFVDPITPPADLQKVGIEPERHVKGEDALFDNFLQGVCSVTMTKELSKRLMVGQDGSIDPQGRGRIDKLVDDIMTWLRADSLDDSEVEKLTQKLLGKINSLVAQRDDNICLIFTNDPEAPGGREIRTLIERTPHLKRLVSDFTLVTVKITGRGDAHGNGRAVEGIEPKVDLREFDAIVILDDISFSGNTLRILRDYLVGACKVDPLKVVAALLQIDGDLRAKLVDEGWHVLYVSEHNGFGLSTPWGFARPTRAKLGTAHACPPVTPAGDLSVKSFMPQSTLGFIPKPWGELVVVRDNAFNSSRLLYLERGERTSVHYHLLRDEIFYVLDDRIRIQLWDRFIELNKNQSFRIPAGVPHSIIALDSACRLLEIAEGFCDAQRDIVRLRDIYERSLCDFGDDGLI